jgi:raffinose/stachyose/melibiose transport system permease protein
LTLPLTIYNFAGRFTTQWNLIFAGSVITVIPILAVYLVGQKYIVAGLTTGAVKG